MTSGMKSVVAIRHLAFEDLGVFEPVLEELGYRVRYLDPGVLGADALEALDVESPELMVILGAPIGANDEALYPFLGAELDAIRHRLDSGRPLLGICLGAQLIARALGGRVFPMPEKVIGFADVSLTREGQEGPLRHIGNPDSVLHWHGDMFETPPGAVRLAYSHDCPHQAFAVGDTVLGLQFHLEADPGRIEQWLIGHAVELAEAGVDPVALRQQALLLGPDLERRGQQVFREWLMAADAANQLIPAAP
ncbi:MULTISPECIES: glutamine amidotransferase [Halomonas]|uniref:Aminodeoxychorismate synthase component 2 n=1 Tax=Halomonas chromatireducens TaxID=507626 RepID=A0A109UKP8_9GAMM|nr:MULTISPECIES: glutamine amidotransferase [Halomonas]AMC99303.1 Aminodeoxychorismate synthase component 2 [Halomonas chromatireducens]